MQNSLDELRQWHQTQFDRIHRHYSTKVQELTVEQKEIQTRSLELYKQLSDSSCRSINGKRQSSRNFKEGVLNLGQIHFEQPKNVLTKEMNLEYQKEQQNKPAYEDTTTGDKFKYLPTDINEPLNVYNPTNLPSGVAATENDVGNKKFEIQNALKT